MTNVVHTDFKLGLCAICNRQPATHFCDYIMEYTHDIYFMRNRIEFNEINRRGAQYETCDLPMCEGCKTNISNDHELCKHHYSLYLKIKLPDAYQERRRGQAKGYLLKVMFMENGDD